MRTTQLIEALSADVATPSTRVERAFLVALAVGVVLAGIVFALRLGVRADVAAALGTVRFPLKFVVTLLLGATAGALLLRLARPGARTRTQRIALAAAPLLLLAAVVVELVVTPQERWASRAVGSMSMVCLVNIPLIAALPLAGILLALRRGAPASPAWTGAVAGLLSGALAATFYASNCPDDSPLFVVVWYTLAIALVTAAGALAGARALRW